MKREAEARPTLAVLEQAPIILEKVLAGATAETLHWKPATDRWSIREVLAHLVEVEQVFRARAKRMLEEQNPHLESYDQNAAYAAGKYSSGRAEEHLRQFCQERDRSVTLLRYAPEGSEARTAEHSELGRITLGELLNEWAFHDLGHIRQICELYRAHAFYPQMGGFRRYYTVKP